MESDPPSPSDEWLTTPIDDHWVGEAFIVPPEGKYDPATLFMIKKAHDEGIITNDDVESLGIEFGHVYFRLSEIVQQRIPDTSMLDLLADWGVVESDDKTE